MMRTGNFILFEGLGQRSPNQIYREAIEDTLHSEELGFEGVHPAEHHFTADYGIMPRTELFLAHLAGRTQIKRLCPMVIVAPLADPIRVAEDLSLMDNLFEGRVVCSLGSGYRSNEFRSFKKDPKGNTEMVRETAEIIQLAWTQDRFSYNGKYYQIPELSLHPKPFTKPHPPIWITTSTDATIKWAAERGFTVCDSTAFGPVHLKKGLESYRAAMKVPTAPVEVPFFKWIYVDETDEQAIRVGVDAYLSTIGAFFNDGINLMEKFVQKMAKTEPEYCKKFGVDPDHPDPATFPVEGYYKDATCSLAVGSPETVLQKLRLMKDVGGNYFVGGFTLAGLTREQIKRSMKLYARHVMPYL